MGGGGSRPPGKRATPRAAAPELPPNCTVELAIRHDRGCRGNARLVGARGGWTTPAQQPYGKRAQEPRPAWRDAPHSNQNQTKTDPDDADFCLGAAARRVEGKVDIWRRVVGSSGLQGRYIKSVFYTEGGLMRHKGKFTWCGVFASLLGSFSEWLNRMTSWRFVSRIVLDILMTGICNTDSIQIVSKKIVGTREL